MLKKPMPVLNRLYAAGADLRNPYLSPVFGDFSKGLPDSYLQSGTRDLLLSNTVLLHRALHARALRRTSMSRKQCLTPVSSVHQEDAESTVDQLRFLDRHLGG